VHTTRVLRSPDTALVIALDDASVWKRVCSNALVS